MPYTFGPEARLRSRAEFDAVQSGGRRVAARYMILIGQPNTLSQDRLGIIASRRLGGAVVRNRAKRRLRELFRKRAAPAAMDSRSFDVVAIPRRELASAPFAVIDADFQSALRRLRQSK